MNSIITDLIANYGYLAVFLLIFIENLFPPIPSEVILLFGGFMTAAAGLSVPGMIVSSVMGSLAGAVVLYYIGKKLGYQGVLKFFTGKTGRTLGLTRNDLSRTNDWFHKRGNEAVFFCRFVPLLRSLISVPAGISGMDMKIFLLLTAVGSAIWNTAITFLGRFAGSNWVYWEKEISKYSDYIVWILGALFIVFVAYKIVMRKKRNHDSDEAFDSSEEETVSSVEAADSSPKISDSPGENPRGE